MAAGRLLRVMQSSKRLPRSLASSPTKSPVRRYTSVSSITPSASPTHKKNLTKNKKITKSQSDSGLASSFRKLSVTPNPQPPTRSKTTSPRKTKSGRTRGLSSSPVSSVENVASWIKEQKCKNVIVMAGAGISTPSGIPDFRTPGTGLYDNLQQYNIPEPTAIFDIEYFWYDPRPFFCLAKTLYPGNYQPNYVHYFVKLLHDNGMLLRMYTQNIDGLERLAGLPPDKLVEAHGTFSTASCIRCRRSYDGEEIRKTVEKGDIPRCATPKCRGVIKPDVVFFGEDLSKRFYSYGSDFQKCDLLLVMGTSLEVEPFAGIVNEVSRSTPRLLINRETVGPFIHPWRRRPNDIILKGDVVIGVKRLTKLLEWSDKMDIIIEEADKEWRKRKPKEPDTETSKEPAKNIPETKDDGPNTNPSSTRSYHTLTGPVKVTPREPLFKSSTSIKNRPIISRSFQALTGNGIKYTISGTNENSKETKPLYNGDFSQPNNNNRFMSTHDGIFSGNSCRMPLLPFRYTHRNSPEPILGNYKSIDMSKDLASAGIGLGGSKNKGSVRCFLSHLSDNESSGSEDL